MARTATARTARTPTELTVNSPPHFPSLENLVGADALAGFFRTSLGRAPYRRRLPDGLASSLFGWPQLNTALAHHRLGPPRLKLEKGGSDAGKNVFRERRSGRSPIHDIDVALLYERLRDGATLILDAVNELGGPLQALCAGLADEFAAYCQTNLYACWGTSQGFDIHWDDHDVFVVQLDGAKRWMLYGATRPAPLRRDLEDLHPRPSTPLEEIVLEAGDMLYLPRGYWHAAVGTGGPTLHLTIGLTRKTGHDLLAFLADQSLASEIVRRDLPLEGDDASLGRHVARVLQAALAGADPADLGRRFRRHAEAARKPKPELSLPAIGEVSFRYAPRDEFRLSDGALHLLPSAHPAAFILSHRGVEYTLAQALRSLVGTMATRGRVRYADFVDATSAKDASGFVTEMIARGVFVLVSP